MATDRNPPLDPSLLAGTRPRRWRRRLFLGVLVLGALVAALPTILSLGPVKALVVNRINAKLAPGSIVVANWSLGWLQPIRVDGLALVDPSGKQVVAAKRVGMDWGFLGLLMAQPDLGTITVDGGKIDVERRVDGTIDVLDAIDALTRPDPKHPEPSTTSKRLAVKVVVRNATLRAVSPELTEPLEAGDLDATLTIAPGKPMTLAAKLADGERTLQLDAAVERPDPNLLADPKVQAKAVQVASDMTVEVIGKDWPLNLRGEGGLGHGRFGGTLGAKRLGGLWAITSAATVDGFDVQGPAFSGDHPQFDRVTLVADLGQIKDDGGWSIRRFELACPVGRLHAQGTWPIKEGTPTELRGQVDLVALTRTLPKTLHVREGLSVERGMATLTAHLTGSNESERAEINASVADFAATRNGQAVAIHEFPKLELVAVKAGPKVSVERASIKATGVDVSGAGNLDDGVSLKGIIDLSALDAQIRDLVDLGDRKFAGHARLAADYRRQDDGYKARLAADCRELLVEGVTATPIHRDLARLDMAVNGPRRADGVPLGWHSGKLDIKAGDIQVDFAATQDPDGTIRVGGLAAGDLPGPDLGRGETKVAARWKGSVIDFDELRGWLMPPGSRADAQAHPNTLAIGLRGRLDLGAGSVSLAALPDVAAGAVGIGPGGLTVAGWNGGLATTVVQGGLIGDLAALDRFLAARSGAAPKGWTGPWSATVQGGRNATGSTTFDAQIAAADLLGQGAVSLVARGAYDPATDRLDLATANLATRYASLASRLTLTEVSTRRVLDWAGTIDPRWEVIGPILAHSVEPGASINATARPFHVAGSLQGDSLDAILPAINGELGLDVASVSAFGVVAGPMPVILRFGAGKAKFDPIATTVNGGPALLQANLGLDADHGVWLRMDESRVDNAAINDAVSSSVLAYIAPVLSEATEVSGKITVVLAKEGAAFPITANGSTRVQGVLAFNDVIFRPGPLADQVFAITGQPTPKLAFTEPVQFSILDGRVQQSGLSIPLPGGTKVEFAGSVGFDKTLQVNATVPITAAMIGRDAQLEKLLNGLKVNVPIGGTLKHPAIDRRGLQTATRDAIRTVASRGLKNEANKLVERVAGAALPPNARGAISGAAAAGGDPKRDMIRGLLEGLGKEALDRGKPTRP